MISLLKAGEVLDFVKSVVSAQEGVLAKVNVPFLSAAWSSLVERGTGVAFSIRKDSKPAGFLLALYTPDMITGDLFAIQYLWMVDPTAGLGRDAFRLLDAFEAEAKVRGCKKILGGYNRVHRPFGMRRMFLRRGYSPFSEALSKDV